MKKICIYTILLLLISQPLIAQKNTSSPDKYLMNPYGISRESSIFNKIMEQSGSLANSNALNSITGMSGSQYSTAFQMGHVVLLDGTRINGEIAVGGRCLSDIYFVNVRNSTGYETVDGQVGQIQSPWPFALGKYSIKEFGLDVTAESETPDSLYDWWLVFEGRRPNANYSAYELANLPPIDSGGIRSFASQFFNTSGKAFYHHEILGIKMTPGFVRLKDGSEHRGYLKVFKMDGTVVKVMIFKRYVNENSTALFSYKGDKTNQRSFDLNEIDTYGLLSEMMGPRNETPSAFKWNLNLGDQTEVNSKKENGYIVLTTGERLEGEIKLRVVDEKMTSISFKGPNDKKWIDYTAPSIESYGQDGFPVDESFNETKEYFRWVQVSTPVMESRPESGGPVPGKKETVRAEGYVEIKDGTRYEGTLQLKSEWGVLTDLWLKRKKEKMLKLTPEEVIVYGLNENSNPQPAYRDPNAILIAAYQTMNKEPILVHGMRVSSDPQIIRRYYDDGSLESEYKAAYVKTSEGEYILGEMKEEMDMGMLSLKFQELNGKKYDIVNMSGLKLKKDYVEFGYFDTPTISEYPMHLYSDKRMGYIQFIDGKVVHGKIKISYPKSGLIPSVSKSTDGCNDQATNKSSTSSSMSIQGSGQNTSGLSTKEAKKVMRTKRILNGNMLNDIFYVKIKNDDEKFKDVKNDLILRMGLDDVMLSELNKTDEMLQDDERLNFHPGSIETTDGKVMEGKVAYIEGAEMGEYYGVYFATQQSQPVKVYRLDEVKNIKQEIYDDIAEFDPFGEDVLSMVEMGSDANVIPNGVVTYNDGSEKKGRITLVKSKRLWYAYSMNFTDESGVVEIFDQNNTFKEALIITDSNDIKYVPYAGVICEVILESPPYQYFRNPFPTVETGFSKMLNEAIAQAQGAMIESAQKEVNKQIAESDIPLENKMELVNSTNNAAQNVPDLDVKGFKKEYVVYDVINKKGYITLKGDVGPYIADLDDLKLGCIEYLIKKNPERKKVGKIGDFKTGEGLQSQIDFLCKCYHPEYVKQ